MTVSRAVHCRQITQNTVLVETSRAAFLLDEAGVARQYNRDHRCWMTARSTIDELLAYCESVGRATTFEPLDVLFEVDHGR